MRSVNWAALREKSPIDLNTVITLAKRVRIPLMGLRKIDDVSKARMRVIEARGRLTITIGALISSFQQRELLETNVDRVVHFWLQENLGRLLKHLDELTKNIVSPTTEMRIYDLIMAGTEIETVLNAQVYLAIKKACERFPRDGKEATKKKFLYCLWETTGTLAGTFGSMTRDGGSGRAVSLGSGNIPSIVPSFLSSLNKEEQKDLKKKVEENTNMPFPAFLAGGATLLGKKK